MLVALVVITLVLLVLAWRVTRAPYDKYAHIPGPPCAPIVGNWHQINRKQVFKTFLKWQKQYGGVFVIFNFGQPAIVVNSYEAMREMLVEKGREFGGRPHGYRDHIVTRNTGLLRMDPDKKWRDSRRLCHGSIRAFGPGVARIEHYALEMMEEFVTKFQATNGKPVDPRDIFSNAILRMMTLLLYGKKLDETSDIFVKIRSMVYNVNQAFHQSGDGAQLDRFPFMRYLGNKAYKNVKHASQLIDQIWSWYLHEVRVTGETDDSLGKPVADALFDGQDSSDLTDQDIKSSVMQLTFGGVLTTSTLLYHLILNLSSKPHIQQRMYEEIQDTIGERTVTVSDRPKMPYIQAVLLEEFRYATGGSVSIPHRTLVDTSLQGYKIPAGTICLPNVIAVHTDEDFWGDPWEFRPERFLNEEGGLVQGDHPKRQRVVVFGQGTRVCVGELFATVRMFLWLVSLVQKFEIKLDAADGPPPSCDARTYEDIGLTLYIPSFKARFIPRC